VQLLDDAATTVAALDVGAAQDGTQALQRVQALHHTHTTHSKRHTEVKTNTQGPIRLCSLCVYVCVWYLVESAQ
jgi:hypothetical protein